MNKMATDGPTPPPCDHEIFNNGHPILAIDGSSNAVECWVKEVAAKADARIDWHYSGGIAQVLHLGDDESHARVIEVAHNLESKLSGRILRYFGENDTGLHRNGVTPAPEGAIASFFDGGANPAYIVKPGDKDC